MLEVEKGLYTWVVDQIQLEEATSEQVVASAYVKPFEDEDTDNLIPTSAFTSDFVKEFVQWVAYCTGVAFSPPQIGVSAPNNISGELNDHSIKLIKKMRNNFIKVYGRANVTKKNAALEIPVYEEFIRE